jgi:hypothetical protein
MKTWPKRQLSWIKFSMCRLIGQCVFFFFKRQILPVSLSETLDTLRVRLKCNAHKQNMHIEHRNHTTIYNWYFGLCILLDSLLATSKVQNS